MLEKSKQVSHGVAWRNQFDLKATKRRKSKALDFRRLSAVLNIEKQRRSIGKSASLHM